MDVIIFITNAACYAKFEWKKMRIANGSARKSRPRVRRDEQNDIMNHKNANVISLCFFLVCCCGCGAVASARQTDFVVFSLRQSFSFISSWLLFYLSISLKRRTNCGRLFYYSYWTHAKSSDSAKNIKYVT